MLELMVRVRMCVCVCVCVCVCMCVCVCVSGQGGNGEVGRVHLCMPRDARRDTERRVLTRGTGLDEGRDGGMGGEQTKGEGQAGIRERGDACGRLRD